MSSALSARQAERSARRPALTDLGLDSADGCRNRELRSKRPSAWLCTDQSDAPPHHRQMRSLIAATMGARPQLQHRGRHGSGGSLGDRDVDLRRYPTRTRPSASTPTPLWRSSRSEMSPHASQPWPTPCPEDKRALLRGNAGKWGSPSPPRSPFPQRELWKRPPVRLPIRPNHICGFVEIKGRITFGGSRRMAVQRVADGWRPCAPPCLPGKGRVLQMIRTSGKHPGYRELASAEARPEALEELMKATYRSPF